MWTWHPVVSGWCWSKHHVSVGNSLCRNIPWSLVSITDDLSKCWKTCLQVSISLEVVGDLIKVSEVDCIMATNWSAFARSELILKRYYLTCMPLGFWICDVYYTCKQMEIIISVKSYYCKCFETLKHVGSYYLKKCWYNNGK